MIGLIVSTLTFLMYWLNKLLHSKVKKTTHINIFFWFRGFKNDIIYFHTFLNFLGFFFLGGFSGLGRSRCSNWGWSSSGSFTSLKKIANILTLKSLFIDLRPKWFNSNTSELDKLFNLVWFNLWLKEFIGLKKYIKTSIGKDQSSICAG